MIYQQYFCQLMQVSTNFILNINEVNQDLSEFFASISSGSRIIYNTKYTSTNFAGLNLFGIFANGNI